MASIHSDTNEGWMRAIEQREVILTHKHHRAHTELFGPVHAFIQVVRHPADVLISDAHFFALTQLDAKLKTENGSRSPEEVMQYLADTYINNVLHYGKVPKQDRLGFSTWSANIDSWLAQRERTPSILVRYEDLKRQPIVELNRLCHFLGLRHSPSELKEANAACNVDAMKAMQEREIREQIPGRFYNPRHQAAYDAGLRFVRKAAIGQKLLLQGPPAEALVEHFGPIMHRLSYTLESGMAAAGPLSDELLMIRPVQSNP